MFELEIEGSYRKERAGRLLLKRGVVNTPVFMPVGTQGMIKTLSPDEVRELDYNLILANTYHLYLRPGTDVITSFGGLHNFVKWDRNILTDSGGFQAFSLSNLSKIEDGGVVFRSHIDGSKHLFTPEKVLETQELIGSEIVMPIDVCLGKGTSYDETFDAHLLTAKWAKQSKLISEEGKDYILMGISQGGFYPELRKLSIEALLEIDFPGYAIGGVSVGEDKGLGQEMIDLSTDLLPRDKPRYLMGVGKPSDIIWGVEHGIDMFDSVYPTRVARNASVFTSNGVLILRNSSNRFSDEAIDVDCACYVCQSFSRGYLRHLFKAGEVLGLRLATYHNLYFLNVLMKRLRGAILDDGFGKIKGEFSALLSSNN